ncbi:MAG: YbjN domain-containing protein [Gemmatimonadetes bacterium]|nr:YbjN domain-containing protein [Gemmatimonadota bacterium]
MPDVTPSDSLPLGTAPDGRALSLNLATGRVDQGGVADPLLLPLAASDWDAARVVAVLRGAGFHATVDDDGDVVAADGVRTLLVTVQKPPFAVRLMQLFRFQEAVPARRRRRAVFGLNQRALWGRYSLVNDTRLIIEHEVALLAGLSPAQLLAHCRMFQQHAERLLDATGVGGMLE